MRIALLIGFILVIGVQVAQAQDPVPEDTLRVNPVLSDSVTVDPVPGTSQAVNKAELKRPDFAIYPVRLISVPGSKVILTDSTIRWRSWLEYQEFIANRPGTVSYRLGGFGRTDLLLQAGLGGSQHELRLDGMDWRNPVTGQSRLSDVPMDRIDYVTEREQGGRIIHETGLFSVYSPKPITRVSYLQTAYELRNTDARVSRMIDHQSGFDFIYQGRNSASEYRRMGTESRQTGLRYFRHVNPNWYATAMLLYTGAEHEESDGYQLPSLVDFNFSRFFANATRLSAQSKVRSTQAMVSLSRVDSDAESRINHTNTRFLLYYDKYKREFSDSDIWFAYHMHQLHAGAEHAKTLGIVRLHGSAKAYTTFIGPGSSLSIDSWSGYRAEANVILGGLPGIEFPVGIRLDGRTDGHQTMGVDAGLEWHPFSEVRLTGRHSVGSQMPEIGTKYAIEYVQRPLEIESSTYQRTHIRVGIGSDTDGFQLTMDGSVHLVDNFTVLSSDRVYSQLNGVEFITGSAGLTWNHEHWEVGTAGLLQEHNASGRTQTVLLNKTSAHWKGYVLSNAAYIRTGLTGTTSFRAMRTPQYHAVIDDWSFESTHGQIPAYSRLDLDLSARVRSLIVLFKYENLLQGVGQMGYYETAPYPMPSRRFMFGLRVVFIN